MKSSMKNILERRAVSITLNAAIFLTNFFIVSFLWQQLAPDLTGLGRLTLCLVAASGLFWMVTSLARGGAVRLTLTIVLLGVLACIMAFQYGR